MIRLLPASATHRAPFHTVTSCGQRMLDGVGAPPPFSSRVPKSVLAEHQIGRLPIGSSARHATSARGGCRCRRPKGARRPKARRRARTASTRRCASRAAIGDPPTSKSACPSTTSAGALLRSRPRMPDQHAMVPGVGDREARRRSARDAGRHVQRGCALASPLALRPSRSKSGCPISQSAGVLSRVRHRAPAEQPVMAGVAHPERTARPPSGWRRAARTGRSRLAPPVSPVRRRCQTDQGTQTVPRGPAPPDLMGSAHASARASG